MVTMRYILLSLLWFGLVRGRELERYYIEPQSVTVSGFGSGGAFASQLHVAFSTLIRGIGIFAGATYYCAQSDQDLMGECVNGNGTSPTILAAETHRMDDRGRIDDVMNIRNTKLFLLHGTLDTEMNTKNFDDILKYYLYFMPTPQMKLVDDLELVHGFPTEDAGSPCDEVNTDTRINSCGYHGAHEMLNFLYNDSLLRPDSSQDTDGDWYFFDQREFDDTILEEDFSSFGLIYVPYNCKTRNYYCKLHLHFHECGLSVDENGGEYARETYMNHVGDLNNMIIMYPQIKTFTVTNPGGCWDWWGYNDNAQGPPPTAGEYVTQEGRQMRSINKMIYRVLGDWHDWDAEFPDQQQEIIRIDNPDSDLHIKIKNKIRLQNLLS